MRAPQFRVAVSDDVYLVQQSQRGDWETIGTYADKAVAEEVVEIAQTDLSKPRKQSGETPYSAVPFSSAGSWNDSVSGDHDRLEVARRLNAPTLSDDPELERLMQAPPGEEPEQDVSRVPMSERLVEALGTLTPTEQEVMRLMAEGHYVVDADPNSHSRGTADIASMLGLHPKSVSRIIRKAKDKLRDALEVAA